MVRGGGLWVKTLKTLWEKFSLLITAPNRGIAQVLRISTQQLRAQIKYMVLHLGLLLLRHKKILNAYAQKDMAGAINRNSACSTSTSKYIRQHHRRNGEQPSRAEKFRTAFGDHEQHRSHHTAVQNSQGWPCKKSRLPQGKNKHVDNPTYIHSPVTFIQVWLKKNTF